MDRYYIAWESRFQIFFFNAKAEKLAILIVILGIYL